MTYADEHGALYASGGDLVIGQGYRVVQRVDSPMRQAAFGTSRPILESVGLDLVKDDGERRWVLLYRDGPTGSGGSVPVDPTGIEVPFERWLDIEVSLASETSTDSLLTVAEGNTLVAQPGVEILSQRDDVDLGIDDLYTRSDVAFVRVPGVQRRIDVLVRRSPQGTSVVPIFSFPTDSGDHPHYPDTLDGLVDYLRTRQADGTLP